MRVSEIHVLSGRRTDLSGPSAESLRLLDGRVLRGANVHYRSTVFVQRVDLGEFEGLSTGVAGPEFAARFADRFASLEAVDGGRRLRPVFLTELNSAAGVPFERALLEAIRAVELAVASTMRRLDTLDFATIVRDAGSPRVVELVWECHSGSFSRAAARAGLAGLLELMPPPVSRSGGEPGESFPKLLRKLKRRARRRQWSSTTAVLALAAKERGVPFETLAGAHLRLGDGVMQHVVSAAAPELASRSAIAPPAPPEISDEERPTSLAVEGRMHHLLILGGRVVAALRLDAPSTGGAPARRDTKHVDVSDSVHADNREAAARAVALLKIDAATVDFVSADIGKSHREIGGNITAVHPQPEFSLFAAAGPGTSRTVGLAALELIFPPGVSAGVPTALIFGDKGAVAVARDLDGLLRASGSAVGLATRKLTTISGRPVDPTSLGRRSGARFLLGDPRVETLVYAISSKNVVARGLRIDRATTTAILDPVAGNDSADDSRVLDVCISATTGAVVVSADHPVAPRLISELDPERLVLLYPHRMGRVVIRHLSRGGCAVVRAVTAQAEFVELRRSSHTVASVRIASLRAKPGAAGEPSIRRAMFTTGLAFGLGLSSLELVAAVEKRRYFRR